MMGRWNYSCRLRPIKLPPMWTLPDCLAPSILTIRWAASPSMARACNTHRRPRASFLDSMQQTCELVIDQARQQRLLRQLRNPHKLQRQNTTAEEIDHLGTSHAATRPAAASAASAPPPRSTAVSTSAGITSSQAQAAAPLLVHRGSRPPVAPAAAAPEAPVLSAPAVLDDLDLDALLNRLSTTAPATGAASAPHAPPVSIVADSRFIDSPARSPTVAAHPADGDQVVSPVYQPRWVKEAHGSTAAAGPDYRSNDQSAPANQAGRLVSQYAGPEGSGSSSRSRSTSNSPNKACLWVKPRPVIKVDLRSDTRDKNAGAGAAASSMQMPPRFGFGRAGRGAGGAAAGAIESLGAPAVAATVPLSAATATAAATVEADISDWWEGGAGVKQQQSESSDSEDEWLHFRQQHFKHRISQQQL